MKMLNARNADQQTNINAKKQMNGCVADVRLFLERSMKPEQYKTILARLDADGFDKEVPESLFKRELAKYVGIDKYKIKYTIEALVEMGYISYGSRGIIKINKDQE